MTDQPSKPGMSVGVGTAVLVGGFERVGTVAVGWIAKALQADKIADPMRAARDVNLKKE
jgi:hypothetical protein